MNDTLITDCKTDHNEYLLIRRKEVENMTALSRSRIYALMDTGDFPRPVTLGAMSVAWVYAEVQQWIAAKIAERNEIYA
jgi:prophage regulatory protein